MYTYIHTYIHIHIDVAAVRGRAALLPQAGLPRRSGTTVAPLLHLRCTSVAPPLHLGPFKSTSCTYVPE